MAVVALLSRCSSPVTKMSDAEVITKTKTCRDAGMNVEYYFTLDFIENRTGIGNVFCVPSNPN